MTAIAQTNYGQPLELEHARTFEEPARGSSFWICAFVLLQVVCQLALLVPQLGVFRVAVRTAAFSGSMVFLLMLRGNGGLGHPAAKLGIAAMLIMVVEMIHPGTSSFISGLADVAIYICIIGPLFWASRFRISISQFRIFIAIIWIFQLLSSCFGVLQAYYPGRFEPQLSTVLQGKAGLESLRITLANGQSIYRPMGLTDTPGGAAISGLYCVVFGMGMMLTRKNWLLRIMGAASIVIGFFCLYLSQIRSMLVMAGICVIAVLIIFGLRKEVGRLGSSIFIISVLIAMSLYWAIDVGGDSVTGRLSTLTEAAPTEVYYSHRGFFFRYTIEDFLPDNPLGAGLGRWGMINNYFGDNSDPDKQPIWSEIMWTAWAIDGGYPLVLLYMGAFLMAMWYSFRIAMDRAMGEIGLWGALIFAYNIGALALTFTCNLFISQDGMQFWLINAALFSAYCVEWQRAAANGLEGPDAAMGFEILPDGRGSGTPAGPEILTRQPPWGGTEKSGPEQKGLLDAGGGGVAT